MLNLSVPQTFDVMTLGIILLLGAFFYLIKRFINKQLLIRRIYPEFALETNLDLHPLFLRIDSYAHFKLRNLNFESAAITVMAEDVLRTVFLFWRAAAGSMIQARYTKGKFNIALLAELDQTVNDITEQLKKMGVPEQVILELEGWQGTNLEKVKPDVDQILKSRIFRRKNEQLNDTFYLLINHLNLLLRESETLFSKEMEGLKYRGQKL